jgi:hypothetical protein
MHGAGVSKSSDIGELAQESRSFRERLATIKASEREVDFVWYPYDTLANLDHMDRFLEGQWRSPLELAGGRPVVDMGAADGDLGFFLETQGCEVEIIDHAATNINGLEGARRVKAALDSAASIEDVDLDAQFSLPQDEYGLVLFFGILYHLQNPFYVLKHLAQRARYCLLSTRIARESADHAVRFGDLPVAYLVDPHETNNDPTNYWIFSPAGLQRILHRTGWAVDALDTVGAERSDPSSAEGDERAFCALRSTLFEGS